MSSMQEEFARLIEERAASKRNKIASHRQVSQATQVVQTTQVEPIASVTSTKPVQIESVTSTKSVPIASVTSTKPVLIASVTSTVESQFADQFNVDLLRRRAKAFEDMLDQHIGTTGCCSVEKPKKVGTAAGSKIDHESSESSDVDGGVSRELIAPVGFWKTNWKDDAFQIIPTMMLHNSDISS